VSPFQGHDVDLAGDVLNDHTGDILPLPRKTPLMLEDLEQDGKPQARCPALVGEQPLLAGRQGPVLEEFVGIPVVLHAASPCLGRNTWYSSPLSDKAVAQNGATVYHFAESGKGEVFRLSGGSRVAKKAEKRPDFVAPSEKAKSHVVGQIVRLARKERLDYADFLYVCQQARRKLGLRKPRKERKLPQLLPEADFQRFFRVLQECGDLQHEIMLKLLFYTAVRVSELVRIRVEDVDTQQCKIFINRGKGSKDRYILFPRSFRLVLRSHLKANPKNRYLFESRHCTPFTLRRVQQIVQGYRDRAGIAQHVHPHLFRHQMLTFLTAQGLSDAQIQLISGHESKRSLEVYQHLSLETVEEAYQEVMKSVGV
jgi:integrase/recombinase XerD